MRFRICKKENMFTTVNGVEIQVLTTIGSANSIPSAADGLAKRYEHPDTDIQEGEYFIVENELNHR